MFNCHICKNMWFKKANSKADGDCLSSELVWYYWRLKVYILSPSRKVIVTHASNVTFFFTPI